MVSINHLLSTINNKVSMSIRSKIVSFAKLKKELAALESVDYVTVFTEDTPEKLIKAVLPDVLIKGADWKGKPVVGSDAVKANGGKVEFIKFEDNFSTTKIIEDVRASCAKP